MFGVYKFIKITHHCADPNAAHAAAKPPPPPRSLAWGGHRGDSDGDQGPLRGSEISSYFF